MVKEMIKWRPIIIGIIIVIDFILYQLLYQVKTQR